MPCYYYGLYDIIIIIYLLIFKARLTTMIFSMNSQDLLEGLNTVTRALAARSAKQILEGILITAADDRVHLMCSDGSLVIEYTNAAAIKEEGQAVLPGRLFTELIRKMPDGDVSVSVTDRRTAAIRCMKNRSNLAIMNADEYPDFPPMQTGSLVKIPQNKLRDMISRVSFAIATDESRQILAIIPGRVLNELSRILPDDEAFCNMLIEKNRMQCTFGNIRFSSGLLAGEYIDYRRILPSDFKTEARANRTSVQDAIERASLMAREGKNNLIRMSFHDDILKITSNAELGDIEEEMDASLHGDPIDIAFNARYITDVIRNVSDENLCMKFNSNISPCVVGPESGDDFIYLILPVRTFQ